MLRSAVWLILIQTINFICENVFVPAVVSQALRKIFVPHLGKSGQVPEDSKNPTSQLIVRRHTVFLYMALKFQHSSLYLQIYGLQSPIFSLQMKPGLRNRFPTHFRNTIIPPTVGCQEASQHIQVWK